MKNQPNSANQNETPERLIRPLEPKRVPSVVPGLEGAAALAAHDPHEFVEPAIESPAPETEATEEPVLVVCEPFIFPPTGEPDFSGIDETADHGGDGEGAVEPEIPSEEIFYTLFEGENSVDFGDFVDCEILPVDSTGENVDGTEVVDFEPYDPIEFNDYLLGEYKTFLSENPDWIAEHSGGDFQAQVITPSQYVGIDMPNPGEARAFDLWFEKTYFSYSESDPTDGDVADTDGGGDENPIWQEGNAPESGTLLLGGHDHDYGTEISLVKTGEEGIPQPWWRGATTTILDGGNIAYNTSTGFLNTGVPSLNEGPVMSLGGTINHGTGAGTLHPESLNLDKGAVPVLGDTHQTVVTGGELVANQPVDGSFVVEQGAKMTIGDRTYGDGAYQFSGEATASHEAQSHETETAQATAFSGINSAGISSSLVTPIVSGSDTVLESPTAERISFQGQSHLDQVHIELPALIETQHNSSPGETASTDDIAFIDDAPASGAHASEPAPEAAAAPAAAHQDIAAAVGGAFVAGSATQVPSGRGIAAKKGTIG